MAMTVDDRLFVIGLAELYRQAMQDHEETTLLPLAEAACKALALAPATGPVEGYYGESVALARYFRLVRALQQAEMPTAVPEAARDALTRLHKVHSSPAMGRVEASDRVLPRTASPFGEALRTLADWSVDALSRQARQLVEAGDAGLLAVAASTGDPVALCVARETAALAADVELAEEDATEPDFVWAVSEPVAAVAGRFVAALARSTGIRLPEPVSASAHLFGQAAAAADLDGRCILVGEQSGNPYPFYHWYIARSGDRDTVRDFWSNQVWTTESLRHMPAADWPPAGARVAAPGGGNPLSPARTQDQGDDRGWLARLFGMVR